jgi:tripartite-type tricarboxylate transporter receptor subunit TctC
MIRIAALAASALFTVLGALPAQAQTYPNKPIRWVVPSTPGDGSDITGRIIAERLSRELGQNIVIDNRGGANGIIGAETMIRAPADGYTLMMTTASVTSINMVTYGKPPYDTLRDMLPLSPVMRAAELHHVSHSARVALRARTLTQPRQRRASLSSAHCL